jgi:hypothetical protein
MNEKNIIIFLNEIELEIFSFIKNNSLEDIKFFTFDDFFYENLYYIEKMFCQIFEYKNFQKVDFDFCFYNMLNLLNQNNSKSIEIFLSQKRFIKKIFDYFYICKASGILDSDLKQKFSNLYNFNYSNEFLGNCYQIFYQIDHLLIEKNKIYIKNALIYIIKFCKSNAKLNKFNEFVNFFMREFRNINFHNIKLFEKFFDSID